MRLIFDIGYNVGKFALACFEKYGDVRVVAVEANPNLCRVPNNDRLHIWNRVVSSMDDELVDFYVAPKQTGISTASRAFMSKSRFKLGSKNLKRGAGRWSDPIRVKSITLDRLISEYGDPSLIKIDVEGYEAEVIKGLTKQTGDICFEWREEDHEVTLECVGHLLKLGYEKFGIIGWFDEGDIFEKVTFSSKGDPHLVYPDAFYSWDDLEMYRLINPLRRINYGMLYATY